MPRQLIRFAFTVPTTESVGLTNAGWRVRVRGEDTYITAKTLKDTWKASLHGDVAWQVAVTKDHARLPNSVLPPGHDRVFWRFDPTPFVDGERLAFAVAVARGALRPAELNPRETHIAVEDRWDRLAVAYVYMTEAGVDPKPRARLVGGPLALSSGRRVWVYAGSEEVPATEPQPPPAGALIRTLVPGEHDVSAPGMLVVGLNIG